MKKKNYSQNSRVQKVKRERDPIPWRYCLLTLICGLFLVVGFFFAARQHFAAMDFGIKNSSLKKQLGDLEDEKRRLLLAKEFAISPAEIKKAAKKIGFTEIIGNPAFFGGNQIAKTENNATNNSSNKPPSEVKNVQAFAGKPAKNESPVVKTAADVKKTTDKKTVGKNG